MTGLGGARPSGSLAHRLAMRAVERPVRRAWEMSLGRRAAGAGDRFFTCGDSLQAVECALLIDRALHLDLSIAVFAGATLGTLTEWVAARARPRDVWRSGAAAVRQRLASLICRTFQGVEPV